MQIDYCLILAAGQGTRMGSIGQKLPKVLWPVFEKTLLELQVAYARSLGCKKIFINLHHMGEVIETFCKDKTTFDEVIFLWEKPDILDIGGAIHNLASRSDVNYSGKLLVLNADQFFYIPYEEFKHLLKPHESACTTLFSYPVNSSLGYNALEIDDNHNVKGIIKNKDLTPNTMVETYTGISYINLAQLTPTKGPSSFFENVCPFMNLDVPAIRLDKMDYWDFGTLKRYWETSFNILRTYVNNSNHPFLRFLVSEKALKTWKIDLLKISYNAKYPGIINLAPDLLTAEIGSAIILKESDVVKSVGKKIWWGDLQDEVR